MSHRPVTLLQIGEARHGAKVHEAQGFFNSLRERRPRSRFMPALRRLLVTLLLSSFVGEMLDVERVKKRLRTTPKLLVADLKVALTRFNLLRQQRTKLNQRRAAQIVW